MSGATTDLKPLEHAVKQAAFALAELAKEKARLSKTVSSLTAENQSLREQIKRLSNADSLQKKLRKRLERMALKLEKIGA
jgi:cell division protein FtsB